MTRFTAALATSTLILALTVSGCASRPKPAILSPAARTEAPAITEPQPAGPPPVARVTHGSQDDLVQSAGDRVYFAVDSFDLDAETADTLTRQARWLANHGSVRVRIEGNADERGTREYNLALGARRAEAIRRFLVQQGVASSRIETVSFGKERPVEIGSGEDAWAKNRNGHTVVTGFGTP